MNVIQIKEDIKIQGTSLVLERGDKLYFEKITGYSEYKLGSKFLGKGYIRIPGTTLSARCGDVVFISSSPEYNESTLTRAESYDFFYSPFKGIKTKVKCYSEVVSKDIGSSERISAILPGCTGIQKGCLVVVATLIPSLEVNKIVTVYHPYWGKDEEEIFDKKPVEEWFREAESIPELTVILDEIGENKMTDPEKWSFKGNIITTNFEKLSYAQKDPWYAYRFYVRF